MRGDFTPTRTRLSWVCGIFLILAVSSASANEMHTRQDVTSWLGGWHIYGGIGSGGAIYNGTLSEMHRELEGWSGARVPITFSLSAYRQLQSNPRLLIGPIFSVFSDQKMRSGLFTSKSIGINQWLLGASMFYLPQERLDRGWVLRTDLGLNRFQSEAVITVFGEDIRYQKDSGVGVGGFLGLGYMNSPWMDWGPSLLYMLGVGYNQASGNQFGEASAYHFSFSVGAFL